MLAKLASPTWFAALAMLFVAAAAIAQAPEVVEDVTDVPAEHIPPVLTDADALTDEPVVSGAYVATMLITAPAAIVLIFWRRWQKLDGKTLRERPFEPIVGLGLLFMLFAANVVGSLLALKLFFKHEGEIKSLAVELQVQALALVMLGNYIAQALTLVLAWMMLKQGATSSVPRLHRPAASVLGAAGLGAAALVLFWPVVTAAGILASRVMELVRGEAAPQVAHDTLRMILESPAGAWRSALIVLVLLGPAVFEEIFYRGILHRMLRGMAIRPWHAIVITSIVFAVMHINVVPPHALVPLFVLALGLGWIYERTGRLAAPMAMHMMFNLANLLLALATKPA